MDTNIISLNLIEWEKIMNIINKLPKDCNKFDLIQEDTYNGIGSCLTVRFETCINDMNGTFDVVVTDQKDW